MSIYVTDIEQGTPEWFALRLGIATASRFDSIITPAKGELSKQSDGYLRELLAEWLSGRAAESYTSGWMERGKEVEAEARAFYAFERGGDVQQVGFVYHDEARMIGCSPDGLLGDDGMIEIKSPAPKTHIGYLLDGGLPLDYRPQVQGSLLVTGRAWCDFLSYCEGLPPLLVRVEPDRAYMDKMADALMDFVQRIHKGRDELRARGYAPQ